MSEPIYVPKASAKERETNFGKVIKLSFKVTDLGAFAKANKNEKDYLNLELVPRKTVGQYGETHSVKLDTWKPDAAKSAGSQSSGTGRTAAPKTPEPEAGDAPDDIPF